MYDTERTQSIKNEVAVVARVILPDQRFENDPLAEITGLAETTGALVMGGLTQKRDAPDAATFMGKGKVGELMRLVEFQAADVVLIDNDLSPGQRRNLEKQVKVKVVDRTELILDIFATHARTYEARLAVELAQLEYSLPRLKRMWTHLSRIKMGVGMRGPGEKQLETDRRLVVKRINDLKKELGAVEKRKARTVSSRRGFLTVSLVGYTNAGKSTLMNALTDAGVQAADQLFATLDTRTRRWFLPSWGPVLLSDTVGFIRNLPHQLIASFKATLEEARQTDLLLHVADASNDAVIDQINAVYKVLQELEIDEKDTLLVLNKIDHPNSEKQLDRLIDRYPHAVLVSARQHQGFNRLANSVSDALSRTFKNIEIETNAGNGKLLAYLAQHGEVQSTDYQGERAIIQCRVPEKYLGRILDQEDVEVRELTPLSPPAAPTEPDKPAAKIMDDVA